MRLHLLRLRSLLRHAGPISCALAALAAGSPVARAALAAGDIAFTRMNLDAADGFSFVALVDLPSGTQIHFITFDWGNGAFNNFARSEAQITWTANSAVTAGTVVNIDESSINTFTSSTGSTAIVLGVSTTTDNWELRTPGDSILAFTGTLASPSFIAGILMEDNWNASIWDPTTDWALPNYGGSLTSCAIPSPLVNGTTAISVFPPSIPAATNGPSIEKDNARYKAGVLSTGTRAQLLAAINNYANWESDNDTAYSAPAVTAFTVLAGNVAPTFVGATTSLTVEKDSGATSVAPYLHVSDTDSSQTLTWTQSSGPAHGTLTLASATASSGSTDITPGGVLTYTPSAGYTGADSFTVQVSDGTASATRTINVTVSDTVAPQVSSITRLTPETPTIAAGPAVFRVTFSEPVQNVTAASFTVTAVNGGTTTGTVTEVSGSGTTYDVTVEVTGGAGEFRLDVTAP